MKIDKGASNIKKETACVLCMRVWFDTGVLWISMVATEPSVFEKSSETDVLLIFRTFLNTFYTVKMSSDLVQIK